MDNLLDVTRQKSRQIFGEATKIISLSALAGDASSRRYYRAQLAGSDSPPSVIIMQLPAGSSLPLSSEELAVFKEPPRELPFLNLQRFLNRIGVNVPTVYGHWEKEGILLLEDLGDSALWNRVQGVAESEVLRWYQKALDQLLVLQIRGTEQRDDSCIAFQQRFDFRLYMWEFDHFLEYGLRKRPEFRVTPPATERLRKLFSTMAEQLDREPACLNHRDYHSWNLMIHREEVVLIDFQDALLAPPQYDLASLLNDRITDSVIRPPLEEQLLSYYIKKSGEQGKPVTNRDQFFETYLLSAVQRDFKVVGRFHYLDLVKGKSAYKQFIPPTVRRLKRNLQRLPQWAHIVPLLAEYFEEMR
ncbi:MAG: aminoglycoside phosphotransferase family protein [Deltaproteobacteria bacterium]